MEPSYLWGPARNEDRITAGYAKLPDHQAGDGDDELGSIETRKDDLKLGGYIELASKEKENDLHNM